jgi:hypothetical protein
MLAAEASGKPYSKAEHRRGLSETLSGTRSDGAIEFKHQNISAVMHELGLPYIRGYKPRGNYQAALSQEVQRRLDTDSALSAVLRPTAGDPGTGTALPSASEPSAPPAGTPRGGPAVMDARALLESLAGRQILTVTGRPNTVVGVAGDDVLVATGRSPAGQPVPAEWVQRGLDRLLEAGEIEVSVASLGHRSSFIGAVLLTLPGAVPVPVTPPRIRLTDPVTAYQLSEAGHINTWWAGDSRQRFWLEITDRPDIGVDLHCPQRDATGNRTPGYSLIWHVEPGDVIFHYRLREHAITAWSRAAGHVTEAPTIWLSHRGATRRRLQAQRAQPGWWLDLDGPFPLDPPLTLTQLRDHAEGIRAVLERLRAGHTGSLYFPFTFWAGTELRPMQPYLNKLPAELAGLFPQLTGAAAAATTPPAIPPSPGPGAPGLGTAYREAQVSPLPNGRQPFTVDPAIVERGLKGHADTQNELARVLRGAGIEPRSRLPREPNFDLAWEAGGTVFVAEIKSITDDNEEEQLRLGLGQVLRYRHHLERLGHQRVVALLVPERAPRDASWDDLCGELGVILLSTATLGRALTLATGHKRPGASPGPGVPGA